MKYKQQGSSTVIWIIVLAVVIIGAAIYFSNAERDTTTASDSTAVTNTTPKKTTPKPVTPAANNNVAPQPVVTTPYLSANPTSGSVGSMITITAHNFTLNKKFNSFFMRALEQEHMGAYISGESLDGKTVVLQIPTHETLTSTCVSIDRCPKPRPLAPGKYHIELNTSDGGSFKVPFTIN